MAVLEPLPGVARREDDPLERALRRHAREVQAHEAGARLGSDPEAVHRQRVATRRLRSLLRSTRGRLDDDDRAQRLVEELRWLGGVLGAVRDRDVLIDHLLTELASIDEGAAFGGALELLDHERDAARHELVAALDSERYSRVLEELERPPRLREGARLEQAAAEEYLRLRRAVKRAGKDPSDRELHRVRIGAKRARYAVEALGSEPRFVSRAKQMQEVLGEHQDAVVAEERIRELLAQLRGTGRTALVAGRLIERQRGRRAAARREWPAAWKRLRRAGDYAWR